ncbi:MAG: hypothetical protein V1762_00730 [Nitrospirota bacterium]
MDEQEFMENFIKLLKVNPLTAKKKKIILDDGGKEEVIFETSKQTVLNEAGMPETIFVNKPKVLGDGSSTAGVTRCQACQGIVRIQSLHRCPCGRTCCVSRGCGKVWGGTWFCSFRCVILYKMRLLRRF